MLKNFRYLVFLPSAASVFCTRFRPNQCGKPILAKESYSNFSAVSKGRQLPLLVEKQGKLVLEESNLKQLLCGENVKDMPVVVISIAGAFRMGKSFLLNLFLRYFQKNGEKNWLIEDPWAKLNEGISWRGGAESHTTGIVAWSEPFIVKKSDGSKIAVILLDTQGNFDHGSKKENSVRVFALSTLFSSLQIFNVSRQIQSNDLEHLKSFVEYSKFPVFSDQNNIDGVPNSKEKKYFQDLLFLVRDWANPIDYEFGKTGGREYMTNLKLKSFNTDKMSMYQYLENTFDNINCYLMPEPAEKVRITGEETPPLLAIDLGSKFALHIEHLAEEFISPDELSPKNIGSDTSTTGKELYEHVKNCADILLSGKGPVLPDEMELIAVHNFKMQKEKTLANYEMNVLQRLETAERWQQYDDIIRCSREEARLQLMNNTWYGRDGDSKSEAILEAEISSKDAYFVSKMKDRRERLVRENIELWKQEYRKKLQERGWIHTSESTLDKTYEEALANLLAEDDRDPISVVLLLKSAKEYMEKIHSINKRNASDSNFSRKATVSGTLAAGSVVAGIAVSLPAAIPFAAASAGIWLYKKTEK
uniref:atlastin-3-like n=1 Tax=Styela clava TaxID=7725 RepID=UPI00193A349B|nr:atlastin-3-like [Styela clava]